MAKQFGDDIESLRHVDESDERASDTRADMRSLFSELAERFVELDEIAGAKYWIRTTGSSGDGEQLRRGGGG